MLKLASGDSASRCHSMTSFLTSGPECSYLLSSTSESTSSTGSTLRFELHARGRGALPPCALGSLTVTNPFFNQTQSGIQQALPLGIKQGKNGILVTFIVYTCSLELPSVMTHGCSNTSFGKFPLKHVMLL